jgi:hypothetical protein
VECWKPFRVCVCVLKGRIIGFCETDPPVEEELCLFAGSAALIAGCIRLGGCGMWTGPYAV